jgi:hypothetical protein
VTYDPYVEPGISLRPLGIVVRVALLTDIDKILRYENLEIADSVVEIIVGVLAILVVSKITAPNDRLRVAVLAARGLPAPRPDAG